MNELLESSKAALDTVARMPGLWAVAMCMVVLSGAIRRTEWISNKVIPLLMMAISGVAIPMVVPPVAAGQVDPALSDPQRADLVRRIAVGLIVGFGAWAAQPLIFKTVTRFVPGLAEPETTPKPPIPPAA